MELLSTLRHATDHLLKSTRTTTNRRSNPSDRRFSSVHGPMEAAEAESTTGDDDTREGGGGSPAGHCCLVDSVLAKHENDDFYT